MLYSIKYFFISHLLYHQIPISNAKMIHHHYDLSPSSIWSIIIINPTHRHQGPSQVRRWLRRSIPLIPSRSVFLSFFFWTGLSFFLLHLIVFIYLLIYLFNKWIEYTFGFAVDNKVNWIYFWFCCGCTESGGCKRSCGVNGQTFRLLEKRTRSAPTGVPSSKL